MCPCGAWLAAGDGAAVVTCARCGRAGTIVWCREPLTVVETACVCSAAALPCPTPCPGCPWRRWG